MLDPTMMALNNSLDFILWCYDCDGEAALDDSDFTHGEHLHKFEMLYISPGM